eukprot:scaffold102089_cov32-Prasinocladus_malaysianus.AAC.1
MQSSAYVNSTPRMGGSQSATHEGPGNISTIPGRDYHGVLISLIPPNLRYANEIVAKLYLSEENNAIGGIEIMPSSAEDGRGRKRRRPDTDLHERLSARSNSM